MGGEYLIIYTLYHGAMRWSKVCGRVVLTPGESREDEARQMRMVCLHWSRKLDHHLAVCRTTCEVRAFEEVFKEEGDLHGEDIDIAEYRDIRWSTSCVNKNIRWCHLFTLGGTRKLRLKTVFHHSTHFS